MLSLVPACEDVLLIVFKYVKSFFFCFGLLVGAKYFSLATKKLGDWEIVMIFQSLIDQNVSSVGKYHQKSCSQVGQK